MTQPSILDSDHHGRDTDQFGRLGFARRIAEYLLLKRQQESLVVGLEGESGSGKSWVAEKVRHIFDAHPDKPIVIHFNPWSVAPEVELIAAFIEEFVLQVRHHPVVERKKLQTPARKISDAFAAYAERVTCGENAKYLSPRERDDSLTRGFHERRSLEQARQAVEEALEELDHPVVVVIDDLDRLPERQIRTVIQIVKAIANFRRVSYLLAYDPRHIAQTICYDNDISTGYGYLEKVVQLSCPLPALVPWIYRDWLDKTLQAFLRERDKELTRFEKKIYDEVLKIASSVLRQPRDAYRWFNRLTWIYAACREAINFCDLMLIEAIQVASPGTITAIIQKPALVFSNYFQYQSEDAVESGFDRKDQAEWVRLVPEKIDLQRAMVFVFPQLSHPRFMTAKDAKANSHKRLQVYINWVRYLNLSEVEGNHDADHAVHFLASPKTFNTALEQLTSLEELHNFCVWITDYLDADYVTQPVEFLHYLSRAVNSLWTSSFSHDTLHIVQASLSSLFNLIPAKDQPKYLVKVIANVPLSVSSGVLKDFLQRSSTDIRNDLLVIVREKWLVKLKSQLSDLSLMRNDSALYVMYRLREIEGDFAARKAVRHIVRRGALLTLLQDYIDNMMFYFFPAPFDLLSHPKKIIDEIKRSERKDEFQEFVSHFHATYSPRDLIGMRRQMARRLLKERIERNAKRFLA